MLPRIDVPGAAPLRPATDGVSDARQAAFQSALQPMLGKAMQGQVLARLTDGSSLVKVADTSARMMLPAGVQVGEEVALTLVAVQPRPTFRVAGEAAGGRGGNAATTTVAQALSEAETQAALTSGTPPADTRPGARPGDTTRVAGRPGDTATAPGARPDDAAKTGTTKAAPGPPGSAAPGARAAEVVLSPEARAAAAKAGAEVESDAAATPGAHAGESAKTGSGTATNVASGAQAGAAAARPDAATAPPTQATSGARPGEAAQAAQAAAAPAPETPAAAKPTSLAALLLSKAPLTPASQLPGFDPSAPPPALSSTARAIAGALTQAQSGPEAPLVLKGKIALTLAPATAPGAAIDTAQLAKTLQDTVGSSGLFYESHVAEWADGKRSLGELGREPQMQPGRPGAEPTPSQLINLQLHSHEQARVAWQGEAWPGQRMEWEIKRDEPDAKDARRDGGEPAPAWRSAVRFRFALLGEVSASVLLVNGQLQIQMQTGSEDSAAALRRHAGALEQSLDAAGAPLASLSIHQRQAGDGH